MLYHLRCTWNRRSARNREFYNMPDTGVPWLVLVAQTPKAAQFLESLIMMAFVVYMVRYGNLVYPPGSAPCHRPGRPGSPSPDTPGCFPWPMPSARWSVSPSGMSSLPARRFGSRRLPPAPTTTRPCGKRAARLPGFLPSRSLPTSTGSCMDDPARDLRSPALQREHGDAGDYAASGSSSTSMSGYQRLNTVPNSWFRVLTRVCSSRCAPRFDHCICCFLQNRLLTT